MAALLYRLGRFSFLRRRAVAAVWVALLALVGVGALTLSGPTSEAFTIPGTQAQNAIDLLEERFPEASAGGSSAQIVFAAPDGETVTAPAHRKAIAALVADLEGTPQVAVVRDPFTARAVSQDGSVAYVQVQYEVQAGELEESTTDRLHEAVETAASGGMTVEVGGDALRAPPEPSVTEVVGVGVAALVLAVTFGSLVAAGLPLLTALIGIGVAMAGITIATGFIDMSSASMTLALMIGLAVGIDYALFIVSRYRHEIAIGHSGVDAAGRAVGTAGSAVVFAGATVIIALAALGVVGIPFVTVMGVAAAGAVAVAVLIAVTLLPAILGFAGDKILSRSARRRIREAAPDTDHTELLGDPESGHTQTGRPAAGERWARFVTRHKIPVLVVTVLGLGVMTIPASDLELALPSAATAAPDSSERKAYDLLSEAFGPGFNGPLLVVVDTADITDDEAAAGAVAAALGGVDGVAAVAPPVVPTEDIALVTVIPTTGPVDAETTELVHDIRALTGGLEKETGAVISVTGTTAVGIDVSETLSDALLPYLVVIIGLALVLLLLVFRSVLVPVKAALGFLLTMGATFGAVVAVFQWGWFAGLLNVTPGPVLSMLPIFMIGIVFGLAMDYQIFLVTRMREEYVHGASPHDAVVGGVSHGARVVTAAALIMVSVFSGFVFSGETMIVSMGFAMAVGVAIDAFVVRMTIVPAVMELLGRVGWWIPRWLDRLLPNVDVEGEQLQKVLATEPDAGPTTVAAVRD